MYLCRRGSSRQQPCNQSTTLSYREGSGGESGSWDVRSHGEGETRRNASARCELASPQTRPPPQTPMHGAVTHHGQQMNMSASPAKTIVHSFPPPQPNHWQQQQQQQRPYMNERIEHAHGGGVGSQCRPLPVMQYCMLQCYYPIRPARCEPPSGRSISHSHTHNIHTHAHTCTHMHTDRNRSAIMGGTLAARLRKDHGLLFVMPKLELIRLSSHGKSLLPIQTISHTPMRTTFPHGKTKQSATSKYG